MDGASGDELEAGSDCPPKEKRYHRHTPRNLVHAYLQIDLVHPELGLLSTMNNNNNIYVVFVSSAYQKKAMHTLLASKLTQLHIPSAAAADPSQDLISPTCWPRRRAVSDFRLLAPRMNPHHKGKNKNTHTCTHIYGFTSTLLSRNKALEVENWILIIYLSFFLFKGGNVNYYYLYDMVEFSVDLNRVFS
ncbi:hypothetical protein OROMI_020915 [Orobanche minor]